MRAGRAHRLLAGLLALTAGAGCAADPNAPPDAGPRPISRPFVFSAVHHPGDVYMGIRLLGAVELRPHRVEGLPLVELSGLAWDDEAGRLYAVSDTGTLFHLDPRFHDGHLVAVWATAAFPLARAGGQALAGEEADAEGLYIVRGRSARPGDTALAVSFERHPRVLVFSPEGRQIGTLAIAPEHRDRDRYRGPNLALEALGHHPGLGWLTAPERPLAGEQTIGIRNAEGLVFRYRPHPARRCALVSFEVLEDGSLLALDRCFDRASATLVVALRRTEPLAGVAGRRLGAREVAVFDSRGEFAVDNFEGLTRHRDNRFFMVSDDNQSILQRTLLVYFELLDEALERPAR